MSSTHYRIMGQTGAHQGLLLFSLPGTWHHLIIRTALLSSQPSPPLSASSEQLPLRTCCLTRKRPSPAQKLLTGSFGAGLGCRGGHVLSTAPGQGRAGPSLHAARSATASWSRALALALTGAVRSLLPPRRPSAADRWSHASTFCSSQHCYRSGCTNSGVPN